MKILISTKVNQSLLSVWEGFDLNLFKVLSPPFLPIEIKEFGGCLKGDKVHLILDFIFFKQNWISDITEQNSTDSSIYFVDQGSTLPFFLKYWHHKHQLIKHENGTIILDDIDFKTPFLLTDYLMYPLIYLQFLYRKPIYKRIFK
jgi:ligand-binding SRPBCC domain-containing protein